MLGDGEFPPPRTLNRTNLPVAPSSLLGRDEELGLETYVALEQFWVTRATAEGLRRVSELFDRADDIPLRVRARAMRIYGGCCDLHGRHDQAEELYRQALAAFEELGHAAEAGHVLHRLAYSAFNRKDLGRARELAQRALAVDRPSGRRRDEGIAIRLLGNVADGGQDRGGRRAPRSGRRAGAP